MFSFEILLIVLVLGFCAYASYIDLKYQKIPNICSFGLLYVGILYQGIAFYKGTLPLGTVFINILIGGVLVVALYWFGVIAPGDAKLLWGASLALPITLFQRNDSILFPSLVVALNVFVVYLLLAVFYLLFKTSWSQKIQALRGIFTLKDLSERVLQFLGFLAFAFLFKWALPYFSDSTRLQVGGFLRLVLILIGFQLYSKMMDRIIVGNFKYFLLVGIVCVVMFWVPSFSPFNNPQGELWHFLAVYFAFYIVLHSFLLLLGNFTFDREVLIEQLTSEMIPAEEIVMVETSQGEISYQKNEALMSGGLNRKVVLAMGTTALTEAKIDQLKELAASGKFENFDNRLRIQQSINFAPIILLGVVLTIISKGPFY